MTRDDAREALLGVALETLVAGPEHELDTAGYERIRTGDAQPETVYSAWIDAEHGRLPAGWIARVAARTVELAEGARGRWILPMADALDRCFGALSVGAVPASVAAPLGPWLTEASRSIAARVLDSLEPAHAWTELATSVGAIWPERARDAFAPLTEPEEYPEAFFGYLMALAYPTPDRPFGGSSPPLWWRFAGERGVHWSTDGCEVLAELTDPKRIRPLVEPTFRGLVESQRHAWAPHLPLLLDVVLESDYRKRREVLLRKLAERDPAPYWDDELGIG